MLFLMMLIDSEEDRSKFELIYETYHRLMFFLARQVLPDDRDAEDAVQEAFIKIIRNLEKISDPKCLKTKHFIVIIVKRTAIDIRKKQEREPKMVTMDEEVADSVADESPDIEAIDERLDLSEAIAGLPDTYRDVILMKYYQGFSDTEIAELTGMSVDSVRKTIQRARKKLEQELS